ncbi:AraC family transcriptional regulator [Endozoicomonas numazuensis]|uniref:HTH araC/xylS-type domain-containing protein n=1 Tax=Endozoicomonas numazuensis TaxID=1137799 RepID=A0A081NMP9_9GAMM|nr:AraC family transcriptional regulator [Endozoicomonas numazuensis]KEQ19722.1 hypothetical protein GZ78_07565 [Endozoicomonas numazuensis]
MKAITISSAYVRQTLDGAKALGYDLKKLLHECKIPLQVLTEDRSRVEAAQYFRLVNKLTLLLNDEAMGLLGKPQRIGVSAMMCNAVINCPSTGEAYERSVEYANLLENGFHHRLTLDDNLVTHEIARRSTDAVINAYIVETTLMSFHRFHSWLANERMPIVQVTLDYPATDYPEEYQFLFFGAAVLFNQPRNTIVYQRNAFDLPNCQSYQSLQAYMERAPMNLFETRVSDKQVAMNVRNLIEVSLKEKKELPEIEVVAAHLNMHSQTLRRALKKEGTVFQDIKTQTRRDIAIHLLNQKRLSIEEIAAKVAFSEPSAFIRAFKSWTGLTPLTYRKG